MTQLNAKGLTIPEVVVAITVTTMMILVLGGFMIRNLEQSALATVRANLLHETQLSLDLLANDVRSSANADGNNRWPDNNSPAGGANLYGWTANSSTIVLASAVEDNSGNIVFSDAKNYISQKNNLVYFVSNGTMYKRSIAAGVANNKLKTSCPQALATTTCPADKVLLQNVTLFTVTYLDAQNQVVTAANANSVELHVKTSKKVYGKDTAADYTTRMVFRN